ncbi:MAG: TatD family hydrolase [Spirochaetaceae bacterium]|nr:TatD family hydrolase [Spirochaetaceae bacterium]
MLTDTHCHLSYLGERGLDLSAVLEAAADSDFRLIIDAGTKCADLPERRALVADALNAIKDAEKRQKAGALIRYTAGIWPDAAAIADRKNECRTLEKVISESLASKEPVCALGECGLDHHWNPSGVDNRSEDDFTSEILHGESELFEMQIELARRYSLPVMVHSRDAFEGTYDAIKNCGYDNGEIHCFSYGIDEARAFLDRGWYIALGGAVTYTKKSKIEEMQKLVCYIPSDRLLLETDAPYLAPVPERGKPNTPLLIKHTYEYIAQMRGETVESLAETVYKNSKALFNL